MPHFASHACDFFKLDFTAYASTHLHTSIS
jgi:hypothetical protein